MVAPRAHPPSDTIRDGIDHAVKVLVIDDQPLLRDVLAEFVELLGHEADLAALRFGTGWTWHTRCEWLASCLGTR